MTKTKNTWLLLAATGSILLAGCAAEGSDDRGNSPETAHTKTLAVEGLDDNRWVYISLETGETLGTSTLGDTAQDAAWKTRTDWDIALCGELVRTNGGTSGNGQGGIQAITNKSFNALDEAPADGYAADTDEAIVRR